MHQVLTLLQDCRDTKDIDAQFALLREINASLPYYDRIHMPSLVTDDYCRRALDILEDKVAKALKQTSREFNW